MALNRELHQRLVETFKAELPEQCQVLTEALLALEREPERGDRTRRLDDAFRAAHNIKGAARGVGVQAIADISHLMETLFAAVRRAGVVPAAETVDLCLEALDRMGEAMEAFVAGRDPAFDVPSFCSRLEGASELAGQSPPRKAGAGPAPTPQAPQPAADAAPAPRPVAQHREEIRVGVEKLDGAAALAEELQVARIGLDDHLAQLRGLRSQAGSLAALWARTLPALQGRVWDKLPPDLQRLLGHSRDLAAQIDRGAEEIQRSMRAVNRQLGFLANALQDDVREMRLVPASLVLRPLARTVRDIARQLGKQVELTVSGDQVELDRVVLQAMRDPLVHLLQNAVDHGIEPPEERSAKGKDAVGRIRVAVRHDGGQILLSVEDDGRGLDLAAITRVAVSRNLITREEKEDMATDQILDLIFRPGFSTKEAVTPVSGRGVGLDVVRTRVQAVRGRVAATSTDGMGATFTLRLPLTLATERGLTVRAGGRAYIVPTAAIERVLHLRPETIVEVEASQAILCEGRPVPLRSLAALLGDGAEHSSDSPGLSAVVIREGWREVALAVDEVVGEREIVVKPLRPPLRSVRNVRGGTLTGSGDIMIVLDGNDLVESALTETSSARILAGRAPRPVETSHILVVDDSITTRALEKDILEASGYRVSVAVDGTEAWEMIRSRRFDLVVTDIQMPGIDGFELTRLIKSSGQHSHLPVIVVTSLAEEADRRRGIEVGADAYIVKGQFETKVLLDAVEQFL